MSSSSSTPSSALQAENARLKAWNEKLEDDFNESHNAGLTAQQELRRQLAVAQGDLLAREHELVMAKRKLEQLKFASEVQGSSTTVPASQGHLEEIDRLKAKLENWERSYKELGRANDENVKLACRYKDQRNRLREQCGRLRNAREEFFGEITLRTPYAPVPETFLLKCKVSLRTPGSDDDEHISFSDDADPDQEAEIEIHETSRHSPGTELSHRDKNKSERDVTDTGKKGDVSSDKEKPQGLGLQGPLTLKATGLTSVVPDARSPQFWAHVALMKKQPDSVFSGPRSFSSPLKPARALQKAKSSEPQPAAKIDASQAQPRSNITKLQGPTFAAVVAKVPRPPPTIEELRLQAIKEREARKAKRAENPEASDSDAYDTDYEVGYISDEPDPIPQKGTSTGDTAEGRNQEPPGASSHINEPTKRKFEASEAEDSAPSKKPAGAYGRYY